MMPAWIPDFCNTDGVWEEVLADLYAVFRRDFTNLLAIDGCPVWWDRRILDQHEEAFWHLITKTDVTSGDRLFDPRRAERLAWCAAIIQNCGDPAVTRWKYREQNQRVRTYLWLESGDYVLVLEQQQVGRKNVYFLVSGYHVDGDSRRRNLRRKFAQREP